MVFVSVTQSFNTATSMGRLTLHMLLSFAQFEREVTAERIRDKIAASKRKGLWMGGRVPLGYEKDERTLRINEAEAETVRTLYALYRKHGTLRQVKAEADRLGLRTKQRFAADGTRTGGLPFRRGHLHCLLTNPLYTGRIRHQRRVYEGQHPSIIAPELWDAVQTQLQVCWFSVKMTARLDVNATPGVRMSPLAPGIVPECSGASRVKRATRAGFAALDSPCALWYSLVVGERERSGAPGIRVFMRVPCYYAAHAAPLVPAPVSGPAPTRSLGPCQP